MKERSALAGKRKALIACGALLGVLLLYLSLWPVPIDPAIYEPEAIPELEGATAPNDVLRESELALVGQIEGPEDLTLGPDGMVYTGLLDGRIIRFSVSEALENQETKPELVANTGGRPLGLSFGPDGSLYVADAMKGLLQVDLDGNVDVLSTEANGVAYKFADHLDVGSDGSVYFSDASFRFGVNEYLYDLLEARPHGRLIKYDPQSKETTVLAEDLYFANGVALSEDESYLLINETYRYRISKYWLQGPKKGTLELVANKLPGFPDNIRRSSKGTFWVCLFTVRNPIMDRLHPHPALKKAVARLPKFLWPKPAPYGMILEMDGNGNILRSLQDPGGQKLKEITGAVDDGQYLYTGSLHNDRIGILELSRVPDSHWQR